jgi:hypothetical protein
MLRHFPRNRGYRSRLCMSLLLVAVIAFPIGGWAVNFTVPADIELRIRLDGTLTSTEAPVGGPFSATVVDQGEYRDARICGHISSIDTSGSPNGNTTMRLSFDRVVMPDGRRARIRAQLVELFDAASEEQVDVEGAIESSGRSQTSVVNTALGAGAGALLSGVFGGGEGADISSAVGGAGGPGTTPLHDRHKIKLNSGLEMLILTAE